MTRQFLQNTGFENDFAGYITQGTVSINSALPYSGMKSAQMLSDPLSIAEISQLVFLIAPGKPVKFSFYARRLLAGDAVNISNIRAEVHFISATGMVIPPGIVIAIRGRDIDEKTWNYYEKSTEAPPGTLSALIVIRLEPPASGTSGLLVDDLALVAEMTMPVTPPPIPPAFTI